MLENLCDAARRFLVANPESLREIDWEKELDRKRISYTGEEVHSAEPFVLEQIVFEFDGIVWKFARFSLWYKHNSTLM